MRFKLSKKILFNLRSERVKISYKKVFNRYYESAADKLAEITYTLYKKIRLKFERVFPIPKVQEHILKKDSDFFSDRKSDKMPNGYNYIKKEDAEAFLRLEHIDFFDYLPKEDTNTFVKEMKKCLTKNKLYPFGICRSNDDIKKLDNLADFFDDQAFSHIISIEFIKNKYLQKYAPHMQISLMNLSPTFLVVKYRLYIRNDFNALINDICKTEYKGGSKVSRSFNIPWYKPKKFGRAYFEGNQIRQKELYELISKLKWNVVQELNKYFSINFLKDTMFPPTFETYSTNIRPNKKDSYYFWNSVMFGRVTDYAPIYNACVCWDYMHSNSEGVRLAAYCGGNYCKNGHLPEIIQHDIADIYAIYLVACTLNIISQRDIAICNKHISRAIRKSKNTKVLKVRVDVEQKLYYSYRFISEFSGKTIKQGNTKDFRYEFYNKGSVSSESFEGVAQRTKKSKEQIDKILKMLNDAAEYRSSQSNIKIQWIMLFVTVLSLIVALCSISGNVWTNIIKLLDALFQYIKSYFC